MSGRPFRAAFSQVEQQTETWGAAVLGGLLVLGCSDGHKRVQATATPGRRALPAVLLLAGTFALAGCGNQNPVMTPVGWWHDLQGGEIAATRPPPPGADLPYPKLGTIPPKPILPSNSFKNTVLDSLTEQRDDAERLAARRPIVVLPPAPPAAPPASTAPPADAASAVLPGADTAPAKPAPAQTTAPPPAPAPDGGPALGTPVTLAGAPADDSGLPPIPAAPPPPATFEGVPAEPVPTPEPPLPPHVPHAFQGTHVLFATGSATLDESQNELLNDAIAKRGKGYIEVEGHGDAQGDSPAMQFAAIDLAVKRARAVALSMVKKGTPPTAIRMSASPFGRGVSLRDTP